MQIHKPGKKHDPKSFENQYREKIERWNNRFRVAEEIASFQETQKSSPVISRGSKHIVEGNFQNLGNKHSRNKEDVSPSLETKLEHLKKKYTSGVKEKSVVRNHLQSVTELKRPVSPTPAV